MRVLIADTDGPLLEILQSYLWDCGHEAEIAMDGLECMAILRDFRPDVLALGCRLLWGGSEGVLAQMQDDLLRQIPVILVVDSREESRPSWDPKVVGWLQKPFRLSDLLAELVLASSSIHV